MRLTWSNLPLQTQAGNSFDLIGWLRGLPAGESVAETIVVAADDPHRRPLRLLAKRLPPEKAREARQRIWRQARKKKRSPHPNTLFAAGFCILLTNLPSSLFPSSLVLTLYRVRWQIEWCFRRWKSLCHLDKLPAYPSAIAEPVLLAKLLLILLMQHYLSSLPWDTWWTDEAPAPVVSALVQMAYHCVCEIVRPVSALFRVWKDPTPFLRYLRSSRRKRSLQLADVARQLRELLTDQSVPAHCLS